MRERLRGMLGIDALVERTGRLRRIEKRLEALAGKTAGPPAAGEVLRARGSFERMDVLAARARRSVLIIGVNLEGALGCTGALLSLARVGSLIVQHYLTATAAGLAPLLWLRAEADEPWFTRYLAQCEACLAVARPWERPSA